MAAHGRAGFRSGVRVGGGGGENVVMAKRSGDSAEGVGVSCTAGSLSVRGDDRAGLGRVNRLGQRLQVDPLAVRAHVRVARPTELARAGVLMSLTAGSFVGRFGGDVRRFAIELAKEGLIHNVASDAHDELRRPFGITDELADVGLAPLTEWLTEAVPAAILAGAEQPPPRPNVALANIGSQPRKGLWRRRG